MTLSQEDLKEFAEAHKELEGADAKLNEVLKGEPSVAEINAAFAPVHAAVARLRKAREKTIGGSDEAVNSWPGLIWNSLTKYPKITITIAIVALPVLVLLVALKYGLVDWPQLSDADFEILSVNIAVHTSDAAAALPRVSSKRHLVVRTSMTIRANRDIQENEAVFEKAWTKTGATNIQKWCGTSREVIISHGPTELKTQPHFSAKRREIKTIVFGSSLDLPFPLARNRAIRDIVTLGSKEEWWGYPNTHGQVIKNVVIWIDSDTTALALPSDRSAFRVTRDGTVPSEVIAHGPDNVLPGSGCLWAEWHDLKPGELAALRYTW